MEVEQTGVDAVREGTVRFVTYLTEETHMGETFHFFLPREGNYLQDSYNLGK